MLEMAGRIFASRGFHRASMDEIADLSGVSKQMLYNYFNSKEGLYFAYINEAYRDLVARIDAVVGEAAEAGSPPEEQLRVGTRAYYGFVGENRDAFRVLFREMGDPGGALAEQRRRLHRRVARTLDDILPTSPRIPTGLGTEALAEAFLGAARSLADWWLDQSQMSANDLADRLVDAILFGLPRRDTG